MDKAMNDLAAWAVEQAKAAGADDCRVDVYDDRSVETRYRERKPEIVKEASRRYLQLAVYVNHRYSTQSTSDMRQAALKPFITNAVANTKLLAEDPYRSLPDPKYYRGRADVDLGLVDPTYGAMTPEERHQIVRIMEDAGLAAAGPNVISVEAGEFDQSFESLTLTSNGFEGSQKATAYSAGASVTLKDQGDRRSEGSSYVSGTVRRMLPPFEETGKQAAQRALALIGQKKIKTETLPIIIENRNVDRVLNGLLSAMYGGNIQQKRSFLAERKGQKIASDRLTLIDDPLLKGGMNSGLFDGDGFATKRRVLLDKGVLQDFFVNWYYSRKLGWEPTTGGPSNLIIPPGTRSVAEIMKDLGRGIYITGFIGGNSNSTTGDASLGIFGQLFDGGVPVQAVSEMNIAYNHLQLWQKLAEVANDPWMYGGWRLPSLVFTDVVVSGA